MFERTRLQFARERRRKCRRQQFALRSAVLHTQTGSIVGVRLRSPRHFETLQLCCRQNLTEDVGRARSERLIANFTANSNQTARKKAKSCACVTTTSPDGRFLQKTSAEGAPCIIQPIRKHKISYIWKRGGESDLTAPPVERAALWVLVVPFGAVATGLPDTVRAQLDANDSAAAEARA